MGFGEKIFQTLFLPVQKLPLGFHYAFGKVVSWLAGSVMQYRKDVVTINLARSFPEMKRKEIKAHVKGFYNHLGELVAEALWFGGSKGSPGRLAASGICRYDNPELICDLYERTPSVMVLNSHFGNWELMGGFLEYVGKDVPFGKDDVAVVYKQLASSFWDEFLASNRCAPIENFQGYVESREVLRYAVKNRGKKKVYVFSTDQYPYRYASKHEISSFMHQKTVAMTGGAALASKMGMSVVYMGMRRESKGHYRVRLRTVCEDASLMTPEEIMEKYYGFLEEDVNAQPDNYLWSHNRWK